MYLLFVSSKYKRLREKYCEIVKPDAICIDYEISPMKIIKEIKIPVQGGMTLKFY